MGKLDSLTASSGTLYRVILNRPRSDRPIVSSVRIVLDLPRAMFSCGKP